MTRILPLLVLALLPIACRGKRSDKPLMSSEEEQKVQAIVDRRLSQNQQWTMLSERKRGEIRPLVRARSYKLLDMSRKYHKNRSAKNLARWDRSVRDALERLRADLQPVMTSADLIAFLDSFNRIAFDIRKLAAQDPK